MPIIRRNYFEEEEVNLNEFTTSWLQHLLARELKFENLVRLWGELIQKYTNEISKKYFFFSMVLIILLQ